MAVGLRDPLVAPKTCCCCEVGTNWEKHDLGACGSVADEQSRKEREWFVCKYVRKMSDENRAEHRAMMVVVEVQVKPSQQARKRVPLRRRSAIEMKPRRTPRTPDRFWPRLIFVSFANVRPRV